MNRNSRLRTRIGAQHYGIQFLVALLAVNLFLLPAKLFAQTSFYQGKTMRVIIGSSSGGGYDLWARFHQACAGCKPVSFAAMPSCS